MPYCERPLACDDGEIPRWMLCIQGKRMKVSRQRFRGVPVKPPTRGQITGFSKRARGRMLRKVASIDWDNVRQGHFITYTYPDARALSGRIERNKAKSSIHRDVEREMGRRVAALYRVEWKPRLTGQLIGQLAPHLHVLYFGIEYIDYEYLRRRWAGAIGFDGYANIDGKKLDAGDMAAVYMAKYCAKEESPIRLDNEPYENKEVGKAYGWRRQELVPYHPMEVLSLSEDEYDLLMVRGKRILDHLNKPYVDGYTLLGKDATTNIQAFRAKRVDNDRRKI